MKQKQVQNLGELQRDKENILIEIHKVRKKIDEHFNSMEQDLIKEVDSLFDKKIKFLNENVTDIKENMAEVNRRRKTMKQTSKINHAEMFVQVKLARAYNRDKNDFLQNKHSDKVVRFVANKNIQSFRLGRISEAFVGVEHAGEINVRLQTDNEVCSIISACQLADGCIVLVDLPNKKLKKLNVSYDVIDHLSVSENPPSCVCEVGSSLVALTIPLSRRIQFVSQQPLTLQKSFLVAECGRGIVYHNGLIYVCCGGKENEGAGHIGVYNLNGVFLRAYYEGLNTPTRICSLNDDCLIVSDFGHDKVFTFDIICNSIQQVKSTNFSGVGGCSSLENGQVCISGEDSNNILVISESDFKAQELITKKHTISYPISVCFDRQKSQLLVVQNDSAIIKVFKIL